MILTKLRLKNFLSVNGESELPVDGRVTVLLGANDHGKSNLLRALEHLNPDLPITEDEQNWDSKGPRLDFVFQVNDEELEKLRDLRDEALDEQRDELIAIASEESNVDPDDEVGEDLQPLAVASPVTASPATVSPTTVSQQTLPASQSAKVPAVPVAQNVGQTAHLTKVALSERDDEITKSDLLISIEAELEMLNLIISSRSVTITRDGIGAELSIVDRPFEDLSQSVQDLVKGMIPRVELFKAFSGELQDSVTAEEITKTESEFLQGIFFYAGLDPLNCSELFTQNDETDKTLEDASVELDRELRRLWAQGVDLDLHFQLKHRGSSIELFAKDPAVKRRHARMSKRSAGVTQFFRLSMVLHARRRKNPANSYIYVFDEPGVFLHPKGQKDLLAVFEQLAGESQIVYATHSLFMLNQNYPERHRLITKNGLSTLVDSKPYRANWKYAVDALGVRLTANILFSPNILLVEGDSDPLYIYDLLRALNHLGRIDADANLLGITSYGDLPNLRFLIQTFKAESSERVVTVLFEGDSQGKDYQKAVNNLCNTHDVRTFALRQGLAIEDYCIYPDLFLSAVEITLRGAYEAKGDNPPPNLTDQIRNSWEEFTAPKPRMSQAKPKVSPDLNPETPNKNGGGDADDRTERNAGNWFKVLGAHLLGDGGASKVALARNYVFLARNNPIDEGMDDKKVQQAKSFLEPIVNALRLPSMKAKKAIEA